MPEHDLDVLIVGSGAGGGIAAYVLAKKGARVCLLEKGPWLHPRNYGDDELRSATAGSSTRTRTSSRAPSGTSPRTASACTWGRCSGSAAASAAEPCTTGRCRFATGHRTFAPSPTGDRFRARTSSTGRSPTRSCGPTTTGWRG